mmetsp:Transcript_62895/g.147576  ORF Transcript_62895/g.147576 Transcript_62895/m.147576 type:complete len:97 (+) Transcript_62895:142-432(+)
MPASNANHHLPVVFAGGSGLTETRRLCVGLRLWRCRRARAPELGKDLTVFDCSHWPTAQGAAPLVFDPAADAVRVEGVVARQLEDRGTALALCPQR